MIKEIVDQWEANKHKLEKWFKENKLENCDSYLKIVSAIFTYVIYEYDVENIHVIDDGVRIYNKVGVKDGCFGYIGEYSGELLPFCNYNVMEEIVGNIYDNPDLIKEE